MNISGGFGAESGVKENVLDSQKVTIKSKNNSNEGNLGDKNSFTSSRMQVNVLASYEQGVSLIEIISQDSDNVVERVDDILGFDENASITYYLSNDTNSDYFDAPLKGIPIIIEYGFIKNVIDLGLNPNYSYIVNKRVLQFTEHPGLCELDFNTPHKMPYGETFVSITKWGIQFYPDGKRGKSYGADDIKFSDVPYGQINELSSFNKTV